MKGLNKTDFPIFVLLCVLCLQRQPLIFIFTFVFSGYYLAFDLLVGEEGASYLTFVCFVVCVLSEMVRLLFQLKSLVGYDL